jgi:alanine racemase
MRHVKGLINGLSLSANTRPRARICTSQQDQALVCMGDVHSWLEIDRAAFENNIRMLEGLLGGKSRLCAVLKSDAYGHGLLLLMPTVIKLGVPAIGIANNQEGRVVRGSGFRGRLLRVRMATSGEITAGLECDMEELVGNLESAQQMSKLAKCHHRTIRYHLALNSGGMSRNGLDMTSESGRADALKILRLPALRIVGIMTHFPVREREDILRGLAVFKKEASWVIEQGALDRQELTLHCANSFATLNVPEAHLDMVRSGGLIYKPLDVVHQETTAFQRVAQFKSRIGSIHLYSSGSTVSYDRTFTLKRDSRLANIPVGYSDGFRCLSHSKAVVLIQGQRCLIVGKVTMNTIMADVTEHPEIIVGDEVVIFGRQNREEITLEEFSKNSGCPTWEEMATSVGNQNPKLLVNGW